MIEITNPIGTCLWKWTDSSHSLGENKPCWPGPSQHLAKVIFSGDLRGHTSLQGECFSWCHAPARPIGGGFIMVYLTWLYTPLNLHETSLNYIKHLCPPGISPRMGRGSYDYLLDPPCQRWVVKKLGVITRKISKTNCTPQHESLCHYVHCFFNLPALQGNKQCCYHKNKPCRACGMIASLA